MTNVSETAQELRDQAARCDQEAADSFERCDTDGFLSQWASGITARKLRAQAELAENGGLMQVCALFNLDGTVASTHYGSGQYGPYWVLNDAAALAYGKRFYSPSGARKAARRNANDRAKGFTCGTIRVKGYATVAGSGTGLSGCASAYVAVLPVVECLRTGDYEIVSVADDTSDYS